MDFDFSEIPREEITLQFIRIFFITYINKNNFMRNFLLFSHKYHVAAGNLIINETIIKNIRSI